MTKEKHPSEASPTNRTTKFLVIRFSSIGDIVLTTPVVRNIKQQFPGAEIHYLTKKQFSSIVSSNPYIDRVHLLDESLSELLKSLKKEPFDYVIDLHRNLRSRRVKNAIKAPHYSFNKLNLAKWLLVNLKINRLPQQHIVDRYMATVAELGVVNDGKGLDYFIPDADKVALETLGAPFSQGYIAFAIAATHNTKRLPEHKLVTLCKQINQPILLIGGPAEQELGERIVAQVGDSVFNACGRYNLNQSASLIQQAQQVLTHDTGLMHIAAAFHKPILSFWGNTVPEFGMYPYFGTQPNQASHIIENKALSCRPCSKIGFAKCPKGHFKCMEELSTPDVLKHVLD